MLLHDKKAEKQLKSLLLYSSIIVFMLCIGFVYASWTTSDISTTGIVANYWFDNSTTWNSVNASRNISWTGSPAMANGKFNNGTLLTGGTQYGSITNYTLPSGSANKSIALWVNITDNTNGVFVICGGDSSGNGKGMGLAYNLVGSDNKYWVFTQGYDFVAPTSTSKGVFHHLAIVMKTYNSTAQNLSLYIDGTNVNSTIRTFSTTSAPLYFGQSCWGAGRVNGATLDEIVVYNGAFTDADVAYIYNNGQYSPGAGSSPAPINISVSNISPSTGTNRSATITFNSSITPTNSNVTNATLTVFYSNSTILYSSNLSYNTNTTVYPSWTYNLTNASYIYNVRGCVANSTDYLCSTSTNVSFAVNTSSVYECFNITTAGSNTNVGFVPIYLSFTTAKSSNINTTSWQNIKFVAGTCNSLGTVLDREVDFFNSTTGGYWINVNITNQSWINISMIVTNPEDSYLQNTTKIWENYKYVYHFGDGSNNTYLKDSSTISNNATYARHNNATNGTIVSGTLGTQVILNANNSFYESIDNQTSELTGDGDRTFIIFAQVFGSAKASDDHAELIGLGWASANQRFYPRYQNGGNWWVAGNVGANDWNTGVAYTTNYNMHYVSHISGVTGWYINSSTSLGTFSHTYATASAPIGIGGAVYFPFNTPVAVLNGTLDEVRIANQSFSSGYLNRTYQVLNSSSITFLSDGAPFPTFSNEATSTNGTNYSLNGAYDFNVTISLTNGTAGFNFNSINYTMSNVSGAYNITMRDLAAGTYPYYFWAYNSAGYNSTTLKYFTVSQATTTTTVYLSGAAANLGILNGTGIYLNATLSNGVGNVSLYNDGVLLASGDTSVQYFMTYLVPGTFNVTGIFTGNSNYSSSTSTYFVTVTATNNNPTSSGGSGGSGGSSNYAINYNPFTNLSITSERNDWYYDTDNFIVLKTFDLNGNMLDVDNITIQLITPGIEYTNKSMYRVSKGVYKQQFNINETTIKDIRFAISATKDFRSLSYNYTISMKTGTPAEIFTNNAVDSIQENFEDGINLLKTNYVYVLLTIVVVALVLFVYGRLKA